MRARFTLTTGLWAFGNLLFLPVALLLALSIPAVGNARGQIVANAVPRQPLTDGEIKAMLQDCIVTDHWGVGMGVGIVDEHETRVISYGKLDNGDSPEVNGDTLFEIGSITKTFTVLLLEDMVQRGEMKPDDPAVVLAVPCASGHRENCRAVAGNFSRRI